MENSKKLARFFPVASDVGHRQRLSILLVLVMWMISASQLPYAADAGFLPLLRDIKHSMNQIRGTSQDLRLQKPPLFVEDRFLEKHRGIKRALGAFATVSSLYGTVYCIRKLQCYGCVEEFYEYYDDCSDCVKATVRSGKFAFRPNALWGFAVKAANDGGKCLKRISDAEGSLTP